MDLDDLEQRFAELRFECDDLDEIRCVDQMDSLLAELRRKMEQRTAALGDD
jgi:hypothetical protein